MMENQRISVKTAAEMLGVSQAEIRYRMDKKSLPIGRVMPPKHKGGHKRYWVYKGLVMDYLGLTAWPEEEGKDNED